MVDVAPENKSIDVHRAFIEGIRTVVIVDDQMPSYDEMARRAALAKSQAAPVGGDVSSVEESAAGDEEDGQPAHDGDDAADAIHADEMPPVRTGSPKAPAGADEDSDAAGALVQDFRKLGWLHDILNAEFDEFAVGRAKNCDLVVLDYKLQDEGDRSLKILHELARSERLHLVILYTLDEELHAWFNIASALAPAPAERTRDVSPQDEEKIRAYEKEPPTSQDVVCYLSGRRAFGAVPANKKANHGLTAEELKAEFVYRYVVRMHKGWDETRIRLGVSTAKHFEASSQTIHWLRCDNVFVVVQNKRKVPVAAGDAEGAKGGQVRPLGGNELLDRLKKALDEWNPSFFRRMLRFLRHRIAHAGLTTDASILKGALGEAALLVYAHDGSEEEQAERRRRVYTQVIEGVLHSVLDTDELRTPADMLPEGTDVFAHAAQLLGIDPAADKQQVYFRLNAFLAFEERHPAYLRTGTVFRVPDKKGWVGICVTPECDLVARDRAEKKDATSESQPKTAHVVMWRPVLLVRRSDQGGDGIIKKALKEATKLNHLFLYAKNEAGVEEECVVCLRPGGGTSVPKANTFFVANDGRIVEGAFEATRALSGADGAPMVEPEGRRKYHVLGQLREAYAIRLLHETGHELSRVGVDFVSLR